MTKAPWLRMPSHELCSAAWTRWLQTSLRLLRSLTSVEGVKNDLSGGGEKASTLLFSSGAGRKVKGLEEDASSALLAAGASATAAFPLAVGAFPLPPAVDVEPGPGSAAAAAAAALS